MKLGKIIKLMKKVQAADDKLYEIFTEKFYDETVNVIYGAMWQCALSAAVGMDWDDFCKAMNRARLESGEFLEDAIPRAICWDHDAKEARRLIRLGHKAASGDKEGLGPII